MKVGVGKWFCSTVLIVGGIFQVSASASECDFITSINNMEGALSLNGYVWGQPSGASRALRAPSPNGTDCDGLISMLAKDPAITTDVGDGIAKRRVNVNDMSVVDWTTGIAGPGFVSHFQVTSFQRPVQAINRSLTFREIEFSPPLGEADPQPGHLRFFLKTFDGGNTWNVNARMYYRRAGQDLESDLGVVYASAASLQKFEIEVKTVQEYVPSTATMVPKVQVTHFRPGGLSPIVKRVNLPAGMFPVLMSQGLIYQFNIPQNTEFQIRPCHPVYGCNTPL